MTSNRTRLVACSVLLTLASSVVAADGPASNEGEGCVALVLPIVQGVPGSASEAAAGLRDLFASYLTGPSLKVLQLEARLQSQAAAEAQQKGCEPILFVSLIRKSGSSRLTKALGQAAGTSSWYLPGGGSIASATARVAASAGLQTASSLAASTKAKDEVRLEYRLQSAAGRIQFGPATERQTATVDGEDLLTPVVARAAEVLVDRARPR